MNKYRVLLADDHAIVRAGIRKTLEEIPDIEVIAEAGDGPQVFLTLEQYRIDCLMIDVTMPDFEPISAIQQIRERYPEMKILVVSAYDDDIYVQGLLSVGVNGYHLKDQPLNDLRLALQRIREGELWLSPPLINKLLGMSKRAVELPSLTNRQRDLLQLLQEGKDNQTIAQEMDLSIKTVENHLTRLYRLLNVQSRLEAANYILRFPQILGIKGQQTTLLPSASTSASKTVSVLVVDDNARYRNHLQRVISKIAPQAAIYGAESIHSAVHLAERVQPQLILIDVVLKDEDGISCARRIKAVLPHSRIVLISAYPDREFHRLGLEAGAIAFLDKKDLDLAALREVIDDMH
jgi:DNA-binding NarL/FixJ family response regulator